MIITTLHPVSVPLRSDGSGALRIGQTRVLLELVVRAFRAGATPEDIVQAYDSLQLPDIYSVLAWCLNNESAVELYMKDCDDQAAAIRRTIDETHPIRSELRKTLMDRARSRGHRLCHRRPDAAHSVQ